MKLIPFVFLFASSLVWSGEISLKITDHSTLCETDLHIMGNVEIAVRNNSSNTLKLITHENKDGRWLRIYFNLIGVDGVLWSPARTDQYMSMNANEISINPGEGKKFFSKVYISNNTSPEVAEAFKVFGKAPGANGGQLLGKYMIGELVLPTNQVIIKNIKKCTNNQG